MLEIVAPPYTVEFVQLFLPLVENEDITGSMNTDSDLVNEFIGNVWERHASMNGISTRICLNRYV